MSLNYVSLTFTMQDAGQDAQAGSVVIFPTSVVTAAGVTVVDETQVVRSLSAGTVTVSLVACDNAGTTPAAGFWAYNIQLPGGASGIYLVNYSAGASQRFDNLAPAVASVTYGPAAGSGGFSNPMTTLGDIMYENATPAAARLAGSTSATKNFLTQTGTGSLSAAPAWGTIAAADLPAGTTSTQGALQLDGTAGDLQPVPYIAAAGSTGKAADAGHVHPFKAWQFHVKSYGAKGNGVMVSDAVMSASGTTLACTTSTPFTSTGADGGKTVCVIGAGSANTPGTNAGRPFITTIATVTDSGHAVLSAAATNAVSGTGVVFGTDDTAAIQSAIAAAFSYAQVHGYAEILFDPVYYILAGAPVVGGGTLGNSQLTLPVYTMAANAQKVTLAFTGAAQDSGGSGQFKGATSTPFMPGTVWCSLIATATNDVTYGTAVVLGGPVSGYGGGNGTFSDIEVIIDAITIQPVTVTHDPGPSWNGIATGPVIGGINLFGIGWAWVKNYTFQPLAVNNTSSAIWPAWGNPNNWSGTQWQAGLIMPDVGNNGMSDIGRYSCNGAWAGIVAGEHCTFDRATMGNTGRALIPWNPTGAPVHGINGRYLDAEGCDVVIDIENSGTYGSQGPIGVQVLQCDVEQNVQTYIYDPGSLLYGGMNLQDNGFNNGNYFSQQFGGSPSAINFRLIFEGTSPGPVASPHAPPATTVAWPNYYYRDAWLTVSLSGGNHFTAFTVDGVSQPNAVGAGTYQFFLPSGHSYTPSYSAGTLTHTVTLL